MANGGKYADISWVERVHLLVIFLQLPLVILWNLALFFLRIRKPVRSIRRDTALAVVRFINYRTSLPQAQHMMGTSTHNYERWARKNGLPITVEELVGDAKLMWIGPKQTKRVVLFFHGGSYSKALPPFMLDFWRYVQLELEKRDLEVGFAVLNYSLYPNATYPTQLRQAATALDHLLSTGVHPSDLHIIGDSAGGNLALGVLSLLLHPLLSGSVNADSPPVITADFPRLINAPLRAPIRGVYLMSPWVCFNGTGPSHNENKHTDIRDAPALLGLGERIMGSATPPSQRAYVEPAKAPAGWFDNIHTVVERVLLTAGDAEVDRDDIVQFGKVHLEGCKVDYEFVMQEGGVHDDPYFDFLAGVPGPEGVGSLTPKIVEWLVRGFSLVES